MAELLEIDQLLDRLPRQLSGGQRQRVALGRTLVRDAVVHLLDEPIAHLDAKLRHQLRGGLKHLQRDRGATTVWTTPDQLEAMSIADQVAVMNHGVLEQLGSPSALYQHPKNEYVARSLGEPPMNILPASVRRANGEMQLEINGISLPVRGESARVLAQSNGDGRISMGIRPTDISVQAERARDPSLESEVVVFEPLGTVWRSDCSVRGGGAQGQGGQGDPPGVRGPDLAGPSCGSVSLFQPAVWRSSEGLRHSSEMVADNSLRREREMRRGMKSIQRCKSVLVFGLVVLSVLALSGSGWSWTLEEAAKPYKGSTLRAGIAMVPVIEGYLPLIKEFSKQTGIQRQGREIHARGMGRERGCGSLFSDRTLRFASDAPHPGGRLGRERARPVDQQVYEQLQASRS